MLALGRVSHHNWHWHGAGCATTTGTGVGQGVPPQLSLVWGRVCHSHTSAGLSAGNSLHGSGDGSFKGFEGSSSQWEPSNDRSAYSSVRTC